MKRSRFFMIAGAFIIATAAFAVTRANSFSRSFYYKDLTKTVPPCTAITTGDCPADGTTQCLYQGNSNFPEYYTDGSTKCEIALQYQ